MENIFIVTSSKLDIATRDADKIKKIFTDMGVNTGDYKFNVPDRIYYNYNKNLNKAHKNSSVLEHMYRNGIKQVYLQESIQIPLYL